LDRAFRPSEVLVFETTGGGRGHCNSRCNGRVRIGGAECGKNKRGATRNRGRGRGCSGWARGLVAALLPGNPRVAAVSPALQQRARAATFAVVIRKPEKDLLEYEKPLPLELIPFSERNDKYWPIGTAFAIGANQYVSAAHVLGA